MTRKNITAQLFTLRDYCKTPEDLAVSLEKVAKIGYGSVQASGICPIGAKELRALADKNGLDVVVTHRPFTEFDTPEALAKTIAYHAELGCPYPGIGAMPAGYARSREGFIQFGRTLRPIADEIAKNGMHLVYHNHAFEFCKFGDKTGHELIFENAGENLFAEIDTFWVTAGGKEPSEYIRHFDGRLDVIHCKDFGVKPDATRIMREVGEGNENWPAIMESCAAAGVKYFAVEQDDCNGKDPFECMATSFENLRRMLKVD